METLDRAIRFAMDKHKGQVRKGKFYPYVFHPLRVANELMELDLDEVFGIVGVLHDTLEDTDTTYDELVEKFGKDVADAVQFCTAKKGKTWKETKQNTIDKLKALTWETAPVVGLWVFLMDKYDNLAEIADDYRRYGDGVFERFNASKEEIGWYYKELINALKPLLTDFQLCWVETMLIFWGDVWGDDA